MVDTFGNLVTRRGTPRILRFWKYKVGAPYGNFFYLLLLKNVTGRVEAELTDGYELRDYFGKCMGLGIVEAEATVSDNNSHPPDLSDMP